MAEEVRLRILSIMIKEILVLESNNKFLEWKKKYKGLKI